MLQFKAEIFEDIWCLSKLHLLLKEKIKRNLNSEINAFGFLRHSFNAYVNCLPMVDIVQFKTLLEADCAIWQEYCDKAESEAKQVTDEYAKLVEEQQQKLQ